MPKSAHFTQFVCKGTTGSRFSQIALLDGGGKPLGSVGENCSLSSEACNIEGLSDITVGPYTVNHPGAFFGNCKYQNSKMEITAMDGSNNAQQQLFATCKVGSTLCGEGGIQPALGQFNEVIMSELPLTTIGLREYNKDGCPADQNFSDQISDTAGCYSISGININNVVVVPTPDMPSTCILTLYADINCQSESNAKIGPIAPSSNPSACIGPIRNPKGDLFTAGSAMLVC